MDAAQLIAQLQLPDHPDGQDDVRRDTVKVLECFEDVHAGCRRAAGKQRERSGSDLDTIDLAVLVRPRARRSAGTGF